VGIIELAGTLIASEADAPCDNTVHVMFWPKRRRRVNTRAPPGRVVRTSA